MPDYYNNPNQMAQLVEAIPDPWIVEEDLVRVSVDDEVSDVSEVIFGFPIRAEADVDAVSLRDQLYRGSVMTRLRDHFESADPPIHLTQTSFIQHHTPALGNTIAEVGFATRWPIPENISETLNGAREIIGDVMVRACTTGSAWREALTQIQSLEVST